MKKLACFSWGAGSIVVRVLLAQVRYLDLSRGPINMSLPWSGPLTNIKYHNQKNLVISSCFPIGTLRKCTPCYQLLLPNQYFLLVFNLVNVLFQEKCGSTKLHSLHGENNLYFCTNGMRFASLLLSLGETLKPVNPITNITLQWSHAIYRQNMKK